HIADLLAGPLAVRIGGVAIDEDLAVVSRAAEEAAEEGGLAGAVGPPEGDGLAVRDGKGDIVDGAFVAIAFGDMTQVNHWWLSLNCLLQVGLSGCLQDCARWRWCWRGSRGLRPVARASHAPPDGARRADEHHDGPGRGGI